MFKENGVIFDDPTTRDGLVLGWVERDAWQSKVPSNVVLAKAIPL
jgi:hypothetical protein